MLNTKFTSVSYPNFLKISLQGIKRSNSNFRHQLIMDLLELIPLLLIHGYETNGFKKSCSCSKTFSHNFPNVMRLFESNLWDSYNAFSCYCLSWEQSNDSVWILSILNLTSEYLGGCGWGHDCLIPMKFSGYLGKIQK